MKSKSLSVITAILLTVTLLAGCNIKTSKNESSNGMPKDDYSTLKTYTQTGTGALQEEQKADEGLPDSRVQMKSPVAFGNTASVVADCIMPEMDEAPIQDFNTEEYEYTQENRFLSTRISPLSTFSIDVDTASYSNIRRFINNGQKPPADAVRIEELVNYFDYDYIEPSNNVPFSIYTEASACPWNDNHSLVMVGLQGKNIARESIPAGNLVFLIDVSGSMDQPGKLPLLKSAFRMLTEQLREQDRISIVVYAGAAGVVLESVPGSEKEQLYDALERLNAGGSTAGGAGIELAYNIALENFIDGGNNRVILATDGDFNIGVSSTGEITRLIEKKREEGIFLSVLGFGTGNYKDTRMESLADTGNGNYAYIDSLMEAKKVLVTEFGSTLYTIAKDVKIQVEFNPGKVKEYRLIGYENRVLANEDFNDDRKDAGDLGAGHTVTAFYEIVPAGSKENNAGVDDLKYQDVTIKDSSELMTVKLRYKLPDENESMPLEATVEEDSVISTPSDNFTFAASVAEFGLLLKDSEHKAGSSFQHVIDAARKARGEDIEGYRSEFIRLVEEAKSIYGNQ